ncbi:hypothetical protein K8M07_06950 [Schnuerera sp. xch1]|uniref:CBO2463/CBO2479 domain-containing protein n=1 Tax=Schnuerera sp. xch1 TaxID=2874283 RepID=UPI001CC104DB|nr:CBO2463/CBO2479 domain-containing protein [Schnuerera sp. xch1]MBZ2174988.1 hypothetical protein [Schnuerera sp. xch1]
MKYGDKIIYMEGIITEVEDGAVGVDFKGRLGHIKVPRRMLITDYPLKVGQEVGLNMSFLEVLSPEVNEKYRSNLDRQRENKEV